MIDVYFGSDPGFTFHKAEKDLKARLTPEDYKEVERFDGYKDTTPTVVESLDSLSLFGGRKTVLFSNCYFLSSSAAKKQPFKAEDQGNYKDFIAYLKNPSPESDLILVVDGDLKKSGDLFEALKANPEEISLHSCSLPSDEDYLTLAFKTASKENKEITKEAATLLRERCRVIPLTPYKKGVDYLLFTNELKKLLCYSDKIEKKDVEELVYKPLEDNVFLIVQDLLSKKTREALETYRDLRANGFDSLSLLPAMASQFRTDAVMKGVFERTSSDDEAAEELARIQGRKVNPYSLKYRRREIGNLSFRGFLKVMSDLSLMERDIKKELDDADTRMELFLVSFTSTYLSVRY